MKRGSQPRARSLSIAPRRPGFVPYVHTMGPGPGRGRLITPMGRGAGVEGWGRGGGPAARSLRADPGAGAREGGGARPAPQTQVQLRPSSEPRQTPNARANLGPQGRAGGGAREQQEAQGGWGGTGGARGARALLGC